MSLVAIASTRTNPSALQSVLPVLDEGPLAEIPRGVELEPQWDEDEHPYANSYGILDILAAFVTDAVNRNEWRALAFGELWQHVWISARTRVTVGQALRWAIERGFVAIKYADNREHTYAPTLALVDQLAICRMVERPKPNPDQPITAV